MKIKYGIFENKQYYKTIGKIHSSDQLSVIDAYRINRLVKKLNELNEEYMELKNKLLTQHGTPGEKEGTFVISTENREEYNKEYNELINIEHDLGIEKLEFPKKIEDGFSAIDLNILEIFFDLSKLENSLKNEPESSTDEQK